MSAANNHLQSDELQVKPECVLVYIYIFTSSCHIKKNTPILVFLILRHHVSLRSPKVLSKSSHYY